jgi:hypothetical protein
MKPAADMTPLTLNLVELMSETETETERGEERRGETFRLVLQP